MNSFFFTPGSFVQIVGEKCKVLEIDDDILVALDKQGTIKMVKLSK